MKHMSAFRSRYGITLFVGALIAAILGLLEHENAMSIADVAIKDTGVRSALFAAVISVCGIFLTIYLAILAVITTLGEERPIVKRLRESGRYDELVHRLVGPVFLVLAVALEAVVCILLPGGEQGKAYSLGWWVVLPCTAIGFFLGLFAQTASVARLIAHVLLFKPRRPDPTDSPEAARIRMAQKEDPPPENEHADGSELSPALTHV